MILRTLVFRISHKFLLLRPIVTSIKTMEGEKWVAGPSVDQSWYQKEPKAYDSANRKTGRAKFFIDQFKPVTVTACQKEGEAGNTGTVCGFVYFPCRYVLHDSTTRASMVLKCDDNGPFCS